MISPFGKRRFYQNQGSCLFYLMMNLFILLGSSSFRLFHLPNDVSGHTKVPNFCHPVWTRSAQQTISGSKVSASNNKS